MIGYYVHHVGRGHLHRALAISREAHDEVTGLSSLPRPALWSGPWVQLDQDDSAGSVVDPHALGQLHWAPLSDPAISRRAAQISRWIDAVRPSVFVSDVSVEAALLARLHGIPVVSMALPGVRTDAAHELGYGVSSSIIGAWPALATDILVSQNSDRVTAVGAISRFPVHRAVPAGRNVLVLNGSGGSAYELVAMREAMQRTPGWTWTELGPRSWVDEPWAAIRDAAVVVTHAGESALAETAAARRPVIVIPQDRPHEEQVTTARVLSTGPWPALVRCSVSATEWSTLLDEAMSLDGTNWESWNDGRGAERAAREIEFVARSAPRSAA